jgi:7-cyano-7-deazaguanine synthase
MSSTEFMPMILLKRNTVGIPMEKAVILTSGGINSTVAAALARERYEPCLLHVAWAHRTADRELAAFEQTAAALNLKNTLVAELSTMAVFGGNARVSKRYVVEDAAALGRQTPATFAPGLMPAMFSLAASWAAPLNAKKIFVGVTENHGVTGPLISELYPDYRREFIQTFNLMLQYALPADRPLEVEAPLIEMTRAEVIRLGNQLKVPFDKTWSCYCDNENPCGRCLPCVTRQTGFARAGIPDPLLLENASSNTG